jgi:hypothetical protein
MNKNYWRQIAYCKVFPKSVIFGTYWVNELGSSVRSKLSLDNLKEKKFKGEVSKHVQKRIGRVIDSMVLRTNWKKTWCRIEKREVWYRLGFITLTLPSAQIHDDNTLKSVCLNDFLNKIRNNHNVQNYIWKAEPQKNGNLHFHITIDKYIHYTSIRKYWLASVEKLGYVTAFAAKFGHYYPPATEIHSVRAVHKLGAYLGKYLSKKTEVRKMQGRIWSLSNELSRFKFPSYTADNKMYWSLSDVTNKLVSEWTCKDYVEIGKLRLDILLKNCDQVTRETIEYDIGISLQSIS